MEKIYKKVGRKYVEIEAPRFAIDFFCFSFLVCACIPPRPIARAMFWHEVIDKYYHRLTKDERANLYEWVNREYGMQDGIEKGNENCLLFNARFNPENQYKVYTKFDGKEEAKETFKWKGNYYVTSNSFIADGFITEVEKLSI